MLDIEKSLTLREPLAVVDVLPPLLHEKKPGLMDDMNRMKLIMMSLELPSQTLRELASSCGDLKKDHKGRWYLVPRKVIQPQFSNWLAAREKMPDWRFAQLVTICEYVGIIRELQNEQNEGERKARVKKMLQDAMRHLQRFYEKAELQPYLKLFRSALLRRLEIDQGKSAMDKTLYEIYAVVVAAADADPQRSKT